MSRAVQQKQQPPVPIRSVALVAKEYRELDSLIKDIESRMAENRQIIAKAEEAMTRPLQDISEIRRLASLKSACEISLAADEPVVKRLGWQRLGLESEIEEIKKTIGGLVSRRASVLNERKLYYGRRIERMEAELAQVKDDCRRQYDDLADALAAKALALAGEP